MSIANKGVATIPQNEPHKIKNHDSQKTAKRKVTLSLPSNEAPKTKKKGLFPAECCKDIRALTREPRATYLLIKIK